MDPQSTMMKQMYKIANEAEGDSPSQGSKKSDEKTDVKKVRVKFTMTIFEPNPGGDPELIEKYKNESMDAEIRTTNGKSTLHIKEQEFNRETEVATLGMQDEQVKTVQSLVAKDGYATFYYAEVR